MSCSNCNRPCIIVNDDPHIKCRIAKVRIALNISFRQAWELVTGCNYEKPSIPAHIESLLWTDYSKWVQAGEPMPTDFQI